MESGLPQALEGTLRDVPSDALFWLAALLSLALGLLIQRAPSESNRWLNAIERITHWEDSPTRLWIPNFFHQFWNVSLAVLRLQCFGQTVSLVCNLVGFIHEV